ncbi:unnamed protein product [Gongylonema pulchrum]|uniref:Transposase n=1 Tax=Gongylonema pulchrum TaxID=637853 RepID=A0A183EV78_9BILA|nr:unnamed protein product [Gongylonema pulchrum]
MQNAQHIPYRRFQRYSKVEWELIDAHRSGSSSVAELNSHLGLLAQPNFHPELLAQLNFQWDLFAPLSFHPELLAELDSDSSLPD